MKILSSSLLIFLFVTNLSLAQNKVEIAINSFADKPGMEHASISLQVLDLADGSVVAEHNPQLTLPTASTAKLFSTATALDILGPNFKPTTRLYIDGEVDSTGTLNGDIWIRGAGDPALGSKYFNKEGHALDFMQQWILALKNLGIKKVNGAVIADASEFGYEGATDGWNWVDMGNYYGAGPSGLTIYDNLLRYTFSTSSTAGRKSTIKSIEPHVPDMVFHNYIKSSTRRGDHAYLYGAPYSLDRFGMGTLPVGQNSFLVKGSLPDPERQFAYEFNKAIIDAGIPVFAPAKSARMEEIKSSDASYQNRTLVHSHEGKKLSAVVKETNHRSVNLFAEHMINLIGYSQKKDGSTSSGLKVLENHWAAKFNTDGLEINDGSGLSRTNAISAYHYTHMLQYMKGSKNFDAFYNSLPIAGVSGTLRNVCKNQAGHNRIVAKSGSMTRIKSYAGYVNTSTGKTLVFALIVNNNTCTYGQLKSRIHSVLNTMATY